MAFCVQTASRAARAAAGMKQLIAISQMSSSSSSSSSSGSHPDFGLLFDIDGVIVRGRQVLPFAPTAFTRLVASEGEGREKKKFRVPTVFVTNAGNSLRKTKAAALSEWLGVEVSEDQVERDSTKLYFF